MTKTKTLNCLGLLLLKVQDFILRLFYDIQNSLRYKNLRFADNERNVKLNHVRCH